MGIEPRNPNAENKKINFLPTYFGIRTSDFKPASCSLAPAGGNILGDVKAGLFWGKSAFVSRRRHWLLQSRQFSAQ